MAVILTGWLGWPGLWYSPFKKPENPRPVDNHAQTAGLTYLYEVIICQ
jgi:hypothetical protein